mgnify:CR=1 FL=1
MPWKSKPIGQGSGFFVSADGLLVTNFHVIEGGASAKVYCNDGVVFTVRGAVSVAPRVSAEGREVPLLMEGIALTGAWVDRDKGLLSLITLATLWSCSGPVPMWKSAPSGPATSLAKNWPSESPVMRRMTSPTRCPWFNAW